MQQRYLYSTKWEQNIVVVLNIYRDKAMYLPFRDHQDTGYESSGIYMSISQPIFTHEKISNYIRINKINTLQYGRKNCGNSSYLRSFSRAPPIVRSP